MSEPAFLVSVAEGGERSLFHVLVDLNLLRLLDILIKLGSKLCILLCRVALILKNVRLRVILKGVMVVRVTPFKNLIPEL